MKILDFDEQFKKELKKRLKNDDGKILDEDSVLDFYLEWLETPAGFLDGASPAEYFLKFDTPELINGFLEYIRAQINLPDPFLDALSELPDTEPLLLQVLTGEYGSYDNAQQLKKARITSAGILNQKSSALPLKIYIELVRLREREDALADIASQGLANLGEKIKEYLFEAFDTATNAGKECFTDLLVDSGKDDRILPLIYKQMDESPERLVYFCGLLARYGDESAIEKLKADAKRELGYLDYVAVKMAVEELGGTLEQEERDFSGDPDYELLKINKERPNY